MLALNNSMAPAALQQPGDLLLARPIVPGGEHPARDGIHLRHEHVQVKLARRIALPGFHVFDDDAGIRVETEFGRECIDGLHELLPREIFARRNFEVPESEPSPPAARIPGPIVQVGLGALENDDALVRLTPENVVTGCRRVLGRQEAG